MKFEPMNYWQFIQSWDSYTAESDYEEQKNFLTRGTLEKLPNFWVTLNHTMQILSSLHGIFFRDNTNLPLHSVLETLTKTKFDNFGQNHGKIQNTLMLLRIKFCIDFKNIYHNY